MTTIESNTLALRDYQQEAIEAVNQAACEGLTRPLVSLPTGTGKTVVFAHLLAQRGGRSLVLAHREELLAQAQDKLRIVAPTLSTGIVKAKLNETDAQVVIASVQSLSRPSRLDKFDADLATLIVDEAHHAPAETYRRILEAVGIFESNGPLCVGFTATPERGDRAGLGNIFNRIVYQKTILEMVIAGYLADMRAVRVGLKIDFGRVRTSRGDFMESDLGEALLAADAPDQVRDAYLEHANGRKAIGFTPTVKLAHAMAEAFHDAGIPTEALDGKTPEDERRDILGRLHTGVTQVVFNCGVLTEGFDEPSVDCIIVARPTKSRPLYIQMVGRGTRLYPGKDDCLVLDVIGNTARHRLITAEEIFERNLEEKSLKESIAMDLDREDGMEASPRPVGELGSAEASLFHSHGFAWTQTADGAWALSTGKGHLRLVPTVMGRWDVEIARRYDAVILRDGLPLDYAMGIAEDYIRKSVKTVLVDRNAPWRSRPVEDSPKMPALLIREGIPITPGMTQGEASDLLNAKWASQNNRARR
jgi:ATP-dependent helicase IRC3